MNGRIVRFSRIGAGLLAVLGLALVMSGQEQAPEKHVGLVTDWTSRHLVFSPPSSPLAATQVGQDPRYWQQWARRNMHPVIPASTTDPFASKPAEETSADATEAESPDAFGGFPNGKKNGMEKDWSVQMGATAAMGDLNYPAKYSFSTTTALCSDWVVYNTGTAPTGTSTPATGSFTISTDPSGWTTGTVSVTISQGATTQTYTFTTSTTNTANQVLYTKSGFLGTATREDDAAGDLEAAIDNNQGDCATTNGGFGMYSGDCYGTNTTTNALVSATVTGNVVTLTALTAGTGGNTIAISASPSADITVSGADLSGGTNGAPIATVIAYNNIYTGTPVGGGGAAPCGTAANTPKVAFAYSTGGTVTTSPTISLDGTQIAFVQNTAAGAAQLVMIKVSTSSGGTYTVPAALNTASSAANYRSGCTVPCMYAITFATDGGNQGSDGNAASGSGGSSIWEDYAFDNAYVGDDNGYVHKFTGVFTGAPVEAASPWPVALTGATSTNNSYPTTSPVFDESRNVLYIGDFGGRVDWINTTTGAVTSSTAIGSDTNDLYDAPLVDPSAGANGFLYQTSVRNGAASAVVQFAGKFASGNGGTSVTVGTIASGGLIYTGTFDNLYYTGAATGHLYVCSANTTGGHVNLFEIPITTATNALGTVVSLTTALTGAAGDTCSSVTEAYTGSVDYIYTAVTNGGSPAACGGRGCVIAFNATAALTAASTDSGAAYFPGGASGIIIDNFTGATGASQIYFSPLGGGAGAASCGASVNAGCAVQAAQGVL